MESKTTPKAQQDVPETQSGDACELPWARKKPEADDKDAEPA